MHILLMILKTAGWILLIILLIVLLLAALLLFVPVRYRIRMVHTPDMRQKGPLAADFCFSWLLRIMTLSGEWSTADGYAMRLKLFCFTLKRFGGKEESGSSSDLERYADAGETAAKTEQEHAEAADFDEPAGKADPDHKEAAGHAEDENRPDGKADPDPEEAAGHADDENAPAGEAAEKPGKKERSIRRLAADMLYALTEPFWDMFRFAADLPRLLSDFLQSLLLTEVPADCETSPAAERINGLYESVTGRINERNKELFMLLKPHLKTLWKHYKPRRVQGHLYFGTGQPDLTGMLTGAAFAALPAGSSGYEIVPYFNDRMLDTETQLCGIIRILHAAAAALALLLNRRFRILVFKKKK